MKVTESIDLEQLHLQMKIEFLIDWKIDWIYR